MELIVVVRIVIGVLTVAALVPQVLRIRREGVAGNSPTAWAMSMTSATAWVVFGLRFGEPTYVFGPLPMAVLACYVTVRLLTARAPGWRTGRTVVGVMVVLVAASLLAPPWVTSVVAGIVDGGGVVPQLVRSIRDDDLSGVHAGSWASRATLMVPWFLIGLLSGAVLGMVTAVFKAGVMGTIAAVTVTKQRRDAAVDAAAAR